MNKDDIKTVLNVGGGKGRILPNEFRDGYKDYKQILLDIDPQTEPDILLDAKEMASLAGDTYDSVCCSHNLEHFYQHDVQAVLKGIYHVLKKDGEAYIAVPNINNLIDEMRARGLDLNDIWYRAGGIPVTFHDALYGWSMAMRSGNLYYAHKCGFTKMSLENELIIAGFVNAKLAESGTNLIAVAYK